MVEKEGVEPSTEACKATVLPLNYIPYKMVYAVGFEPTIPYGLLIPNQAFYQAELRID
jgi:hypothetical protein